MGVALTHRWGAMGLRWGAVGLRWGAVGAVMRSICSVSSRRGMCLGLVIPTLPCGVIESNASSRQLIDISQFE